MEEEEELEEEFQTPTIKTDVTHVSDMYSEWFMDYASYVILERAVPHLNDGLKPVQRRILHSMKDLDDGRYNKVANIVGHTMQSPLASIRSNRVVNSVRSCHARA